MQFRWNVNKNVDFFKLFLLREPFAEMTKLAEKFGEIYFLRLGTVDAVVVSSYRLIKQVLVEKSGDFGDRCGFRRYHVLFGGDKENCKQSPILFLLSPFPHFP